MLINVDSNTNNNVLIIGAGEAGGRIAQNFYEKGFPKVIAINTAKADLDGLNLSEDSKFLIPVTNGEGAGKDPSIIRNSIDSFYENTLNFIKSKIDSQDSALICVGGGGGTGGGLGIVLAEMVNSLGLNVGLIFTLPIKNESTLVFVNSLHNLNEIYENVKNAAISPFIVVDNNELFNRYNPSVSNFWSPINGAISDVIKSFNELSLKPSKYISALDRKDLQRILSVGGSCAIGSCDIQSTDTAETVMEKLSKSFFMDGFDLRTAKSAGVIIVGTETTLATTESTKVVNTIFDKVGTMLGGGMFFRGVYEEKDVKFLKVYVIFNGMTLPEERINEMMKEINAGYGKIKSQENRIDGVFFDMNEKVAGLFGNAPTTGGSKKIVRGSSPYSSTHRERAIVRQPVNIPGVQRKDRR